jgi:hypothetical protein
MAIIFFLDIIFPELEISGISALFFTSLIVWVLNLFFNL